MSTPTVLDREEYIEQAYMFRVLRERLADNYPAQEILGQLDQEILSTTRLPYAIQFLATEIKHSGLLGTGFDRLTHYFSHFQAFVVSQAEQEGLRFTMPTAFLILEREAVYKASQPSPAGLFVYQFETLCRNRLGYGDGLLAMAKDPFYDADWKRFLEGLRKQIGVFDFAELLYVRSQFYLIERRRQEPHYEPPLPPLFGEKEGKIAKASKGRDPLYFFSALQRQLAYPEVPRYSKKDDISTKLEIIQNKLREMENRIKLAEGELRGNVDLTELAKPDLLKDRDDDD